MERHNNDNMLRPFSRSLHDEGIPLLTIAMFSLTAFVALGVVVAWRLPPASSGASAARPGVAGNAGRSDGDTGRALQATALSTLPTGLEARLAASPDDFGLRLLVAQTFLARGQNEEAAMHLAHLRKQAPHNPRVVVLLARALVESSSQAELRRLLLSLAAIPTVHPPLAVEARTVMGHIHARLGDKGAAREQWARVLEALPPADRRRGALQLQLARLAR